ncbi:stress protein, partial [Mycobacterium sp. ITM-2017-0098]
MIRNVVLAKLKTGYDAAEVEAIQDGLRGLDLPGTVRYTVGTDAGLRDGNWDFVIVADFEDVVAYRGYDDDAAHN